MGKLAGLFVIVLTLAFAPAPFADDRAIETIGVVKQSIVGIGTFEAMRQPQSRLLGTGFIVGDGRYAVTNAHVVPRLAEDERFESVVVFAPQNSGGALNGQAQVRPATVAAVDRDHDIIILRFEGPPLPALDLAPRSTVVEGQMAAFTGFPIGSVLGLYPATHRGYVAAITPVATPAPTPGEISPATLRRLRDNFRVYQLDAVAYPGNSGSPVYDPETGRVFAVINSVFVKESKENAITAPSGITYAIPIRFVTELLATLQ